MKILIVSDVHGNYKNMKKVLDNHPNFDYFFLLGDVLSGPDIDGYDPSKLSELLNQYSNKIFYVKGNCDVFHMDSLDFYMDKDYMILPFDGITFFLTHGHIYRPYSMIEDDYDVFLSGHTHKPAMDKMNSRYYLNPGSITLPRGDSNPTYIVYENKNFRLEDLDKNIIKTISYSK